MATAEREDHKVTRNSSFFKQVHKSPTIPPKDDGEFNENTDNTDERNLKLFKTEYQFKMYSYRGVK